MLPVADGPDAHDLVSAARDLLRKSGEAQPGLWPRAGAMLGRQALERALARAWEIAAPGLERTPMRCQVLCAGAMFNDAELGTSVGRAWRTLSAACHHRVYELAPDTDELGAALETVWDLAEAADRLHAHARR
jgi:hypothetical protein